MILTQLHQNQISKRMIFQIYLKYLILINLIINFRIILMVALYLFIKSINFEETKMNFIKCCYFLAPLLGAILFIIQFNLIFLIIFHSNQLI